MRVFHGLFSPVFLDEGESGVDEDDGEDGQAQRQQPLAGAEIIGEKAQGRSEPEQHGQKMAELGQESAVQGDSAAFADFVGPIFLQAFFGFGRGEAVGRGQHGPKDFCFREGWDIHGRGTLGNRIIRLQGVSRKTCSTGLPPMRLSHRPLSLAPMMIKSSW